jgi:hypothetical protein
MKQFENLKMYCYYITDSFNFQIIQFSNFQIIKI